jgi:hypothetical protein
VSAAPAGQDPVQQDQVLKVRRLVDADDAATAEPVLDTALPVGVDRVSFSELVLEAASEAEFVEMLRQIQKRSGRSAGKISAYTGGVVPRATAYHFVAATTKRMPTRREQLEKFVIACGLNTIQVRRVLWLWDQLREDTATKAQAASRGSVVEGVLVEQTSGALVLRSGQELVSQAGAERVSEEFAGFAGSVHTLVVKGDFRVEHHHHHHDEAGRRDDRGEQNTQAGAGGGEESPSGRRGVLAEALKDPRMFRHLMLLLTFVAVFVLGTVSLVVVSVVKAPTTTIMIPVMVVVAAGVALVRLAYGFPDLPGLRERRRGEPPSA